MAIGLYSVTSRSGSERRISRSTHLSFAGLLLVAVGFCLISRSGSIIDSVPVYRPFLVMLGGIHEAVQGRVVSSDEILGQLERERLKTTLLEVRLEQSMREQGESAGLSLTGDLMSDYRRVAVAGVLPSPTQRHIGIPDGSGSGLNEANEVLAVTEFGPALVGRVLSSSKNSAVVLSVDDPSSSISVYVEGIGTGLLYQGGYPASAGHLLYVPRNAQIAPGSAVRSIHSATGQSWLVGFIKDVKVTDEFFLEATVTPAVFPEKLTHVWVRKE